MSPTKRTSPPSYPATKSWKETASSRRPIRALRSQGLSSRVCSFKRPAMRSRWRRTDSRSSSPRGSWPASGRRRQPRLPRNGNPWWRKFGMAFGSCLGIDDSGPSPGAPEPRISSRVRCSRSSPFTRSASWAWTPSGSDSLEQSAASAGFSAKSWGCIPRSSSRSSEACSRSLGSSSPRGGNSKRFRHPPKIETGVCEPASRSGSHHEDGSETEKGPKPEQDQADYPREERRSHPELLREDRNRQAAHPYEAHRARDEQHHHEEPAAPDAVQRVPKPHPPCADPAGSPVVHDEPHGGGAVFQAYRLRPGHLPRTGGDHRSGGGKDLHPP